MPEAAELAVVARDLAVCSPQGPVYGPVDLDVHAGGVTVLVAAAGTGRTALLMTLAGRMRQDRGTLSVFGATEPRKIFATAAIAGVDELDTLADAVTVRDAVTEQMRWNAPWYRRIRPADTADLQRICAPVFGELPLPPLSSTVEELSELDRLLLRIALADTARPPLLIVGGLDLLTSDRNRELLLQRLIDLGGTRTVITATVNGVTTEAVRAQIIPDEEGV